ncbi:U3 small nucleolar ribonucleoprotein protein MPP10-like [Ruditapes philippinarum]|uniref:U3 small nucleolar ribonucleoprotein protein MPP10-like n=1 Tax=Ruditapes philippinarum TaxID=129788 RepID=UPI00295C05A9|nr:U3 small nucleolar ribonucleoprotein protein MPP10-like [Ruditapes philippinarum]
MAAPIRKKFQANSSKVISLTDNLENFISAGKSFSSKYTDPLKNLYDISKTVIQDNSSSSTLQELIVSDFDDEQIWQQLELENEACVSNLLSGAAKILSSKNQCSFKDKSSEVLSKSKQIKKVVTSDVLKSKTKEKISKKKKDIKELKATDGEVDDFVDDLGNNSDDIDEDDDDKEIAEIENKLNRIDEDDKFFDFTGDSDEDLNFDFGPLGQKGDLDDELFKNDSEDDHNEDRNVKPKNKTKKSVTFKDQKENEVTNKKEINKKGGKKFSKRGSIVDDAFFKLAELETFLDQEDKREERRLKKTKHDKVEDDDDDDSDEEDNEEDNIDMFGDIDSAEEEAHYEDFFDPPEGEVEGPVDREKDVPKQEIDEEEWEDDDDEDFDENEENEEDRSGDEEAEEAKDRRGQDLFADSDSEGEDVADILGGKKEEKSSYEIRQERLKKKISAIEDDMLSQKPWQLAGEISAGKRPENSLLQENLQFEHTTRLPPEITEETTKTLEDLIRQRIKDKAWDDVERKVKPKDNPFEYKKRITLDQEKSKLSLNEIYEQEYLKQQKTEEVEKTDPDHDEIKKMMQSLFLKLDALSNFHYTPKQATAEVTIISNQPSITMEEVAPVSISDGQLLAPEEIKDKERQEVKGSTEKTASDRLRDRKIKKKKQRTRKKEKERREKLVEQLNPGLGNKYSKEKALQKLEKESRSDAHGITMIKGDKKERTGLTSSKAFFTQLQEEVTSNISRKRKDQPKNQKESTQGGKKLKL